MPLVLSDVVSLESCVVDVITTMADGIAIFPIKADVISHLCLGGRCYNHIRGMIWLMLLPSGRCCSHYRVV